MSAWFSKYLLIIISLFLGSQVELAGQSNKREILGIWLNQEGTAKIKLSTHPVHKDRIQGKIVWLKHPKRNGKVKVDINNPNEKLRNRKMLGLTIMKTYRYNPKESRWEGEIYDPVSGLTYDSYIVKKEKKLKLRGYIGFEWIGRTAIWTPSSLN